MAKQDDVSKIEAQAQKWVRLLFDVSKEFSSSLELDEVLSRVLKQTVKIASATEGSIFLLGERGQVLRSIIARAELPPEIKTPVVETVMSEGIAGWVYKHKQHAVVADTKSDERWKDFPDDRLLTRSAISVPILDGGNVRGIFTLTHTEPNSFSDEYYNVLGPIAEQASIAIRNAVAYTETRSEWVVLQAIIHAVREPILTLDNNDVLILFNKAAADKLNLSKAAEGQKIDSVITDKALLAFLLKRDVETEQVTLGDGQLFECAMSKILGMGRVVTLHDVTMLNKLIDLVNNWS